MNASEKIIHDVEMAKGSHADQGMDVVCCDRFAVMSSGKTPGGIVDCDIAELVSHRRWCIDSGGYPVANCGGSLVRLFDYVMAKSGVFKPKGCYVDHINLDKLDNRRQNLRIVSPTENAKNVPLRANNTSGYTGVSKKITKNGHILYRSYITINKKRIHLGEFKTIQDAAQARSLAESKYGFYTRTGTVLDVINHAMEKERRQSEQRTN